MAKSKFVIPESEQHAYKMLVQRANRRVKSNLKYIQANNITNEHTQRALVGGFMDIDKWATGKMPFSRSNEGRYMWNADAEKMEFMEFGSEREYRQHIAYLEKWGEKTAKRNGYHTHPDQIKNSYKSAIIKALNEVKDHYSITLPNGQIPKEVLKALDDLTLSQITNFFANGDPSEDVEIAQFDSDDFINVEDAEDFVDVITSRISQIKKYH